MSDVDTEDFEFSDEPDLEDEQNTDEPVLETAEEYGYVEPSTDVPPPDVYADQNPGFVEGAHA